MRNNIILAFIIGLAYAYPGVPLGERITRKKYDTILHASNEEIGLDNKKLTKAQSISKARNNCGAAYSCKTFNEKTQIRPVTGKHAFVSPAVTDIRGPCPGLNAAANHGYIPRNGIMDFDSTIQGMFFMYSMSKNLNSFLVAYAILVTGDIVTTKWSIGRPLPYKSLGGLIPPPQGLSCSHNKFEGDSSLSRNDYDLNSGDAHSLNITRYKTTYLYGAKDDRFTMDKLVQSFTKNTIRSIKENSLYVAPLFSTTVITPAMYNFAIAFMSNHTKEEPAGYLNGYILNSFFGIKGVYPNFRWAPGQERVPRNWYARPSNAAYDGIGGLIGDLVVGFNAYPESFRLGGNKDGLNSYIPISISNFTRGAYPDYTYQNVGLFACLFYQYAEQYVPNASNYGPPDCPKSSEFTGIPPAGYPGGGNNTRCRNGTNY